MTALVLVLVVLVCGLLAYLLWVSSKLSTPALDPEEALRAEIELHRVARKLDIARVKHEQRSDAARARREIAEVLEGRD